MPAAKALYKVIDDSVLDLCCTSVQGPGDLIVRCPASPFAETDALPCTWLTLKGILDFPMRLSYTMPSDLLIAV